MISKTSRIAPVVLMLLLALLLGACGKTPSTRFYALAALAETGFQTPERSPQEMRRVVAVGPIALPKYLAHPAITSREGATVLKRSELDRWGGSLEDEASRVLVENLERLLPGDRYLVLPWLESGKSDYRAQLNITRFDGPTSGPVELKAAWLLFGESDKVFIAGGTETIVEPLQGEGYAATTEAMSRALLALSRRLADEISDKPGR